MAYRVAMASSDGVNIDLHFNQAEKFFIYDVTEDGSRFVEERGIEKLFTHSHSEFEKITALLSDCGAVFVSRLGPGAAKYLLTAGFRVFEAPYGVQDVLKKLEEENILGGTVT